MSPALCRALRGIAGVLNRSRFASWEDALLLYCPQAGIESCRSLLYRDVVKPSRAYQFPTFMKTILVIDDNSSFREVASEVLLAADYDVIAAACPDDAFQLLEREQVDLILCDLHMPFTFGERYAQFEHSHRVGIKTIQELAAVFPATPVVGLTATSRDDLQRIARTLGDIPTFEKPSNRSELLGIVQRCFELPGDGQRH